ARRFAETRRLLAETQQRAAELAVLTGVQQALAAQFDIQAIYDLVGDKIQEMFDAQAVTITTFDLTTQMSYPRYVIEKGTRYFPQPRPLGNLARSLIATRQPELLTTRTDFERFGLSTIPGTEPSRSGLYVPLVAGDEVRGLIALQ